MYETTKKRAETVRLVTEMWFESTLEHQELRYVKNSALGDRTPLYLSGSVCQNKAKALNKHIGVSANKTEDGFCPIKVPWLCRGEQTAQRR